jgi:hypothetical protein
LGEIWKTLTEDEKAPYIAQAKEDQERVANLKAGTGEKAPVNKNASKKENVPKQAADPDGNAEAPEAGTSTADQMVASKKRKADKVCDVTLGQTQCAACIQRSMHATYNHESPGSPAMTALQICLNLWSTDH